MSQRYEKLRDRLAGREIIILDGGIGSEMLRRGVTWEGHKVESEPDAIRSIHADYIRAGADVVSTNTFQLARRSYLNHFADLDHMRHIGAPDLEHRAAFRAGDRIVVQVIVLCAARGAEAFRAELGFRHGRKSLPQVESEPPLGGLRARCQ